MAKFMWKKFTDGRDGYKCKIKHILVIWTLQVEKRTDPTFPYKWSWITMGFKIDNLIITNKGEQGLVHTLKEAKFEAEKKYKELTRERSQKN